MEKFFNYLYSIEHITTYLVIAIVVLIALFFIILIFGKKDQKLEETKRLEALNANDNNKDTNTLKETSTPEKVEVPAQNIEEKYPDILIPENNTVNAVNDKIEISSVPEQAIVPVEENIPVPQAEPVVPPVVEPTPVVEPAPTKPVLDAIKEAPLNIKEEIKEPEITIPEPEMPEVKVFDNHEEDEKPVRSESLFDGFINPVSEEPKPEVKEPEPVVEPKDNTGYNGTLPKAQIFSSVYVNNQNDLPKEEVKEKSPALEIKDVDEVDEDAFELPALKTETHNSNDDNTIGFDSIVGETYNINK